MYIADYILNFIRTHLCVQARSVALDTNLSQVGQLDSTAMLELILWVGDTFNISIQNEDFTPENFATPRNIVDFVQRNASGLVGGIQAGSPASVLGGN